MTTSNHARLILSLLLASLVFLPLSPPNVLAQQFEPSVIQDLDSYVEDRLDASNVPGAALSIIQDGAIQHARGYGETAHDGQPVSPDTLFAIGSTTKSMTALAIMQLVEAGEFGLDDPVVELLPWFEVGNSGEYGPITIRHLLTMTSGIPANAGGEAFRSTLSVSPEEAIRSLRSSEIQFEPGTRFEYVNANYVILGHVVEVVSGQSYGEYLEQHLFSPLGMTSTFTDIGEARDAGFAPGHRYFFGWPVAHEMPQHDALVPAGYVISTADDLSRYLSMYLNGGVLDGVTILSADGIDQLLDGSIAAQLGPWANGAEAEYAMGWYTGGPWSVDTVAFHPGSEPTFTSMLMLDRSKGVGVVTLMNASTEMPLPGAAGVLRVLPAGVMSILQGDEPAQSGGLERFYIVFNLIVVGVLLLQSMALIRMVRRGIREGTLLPRDGGRSRHALSVLPLIWEVGLSTILVFVPSLMGMSWRSMWLRTPDLAIVLATVASLWLVTGGVRVVLLGRSIWSEHHLAARVEHGEKGWKSPKPSD